MKVLGSDGGRQCEYHHMTAGPQMCCRNYPDVVSDAVKYQGGWGDCPALVSWWRFLQDRTGKSEAGHGKFYADIGANIGSCLLPMMAQPDVENALAFEPNPANLFYLTSSILANPQIKQKVKLYPFALGSGTKTKPIYTEAGNAGNTVVGQATHTTGGIVGEVKIKKLDDVLMSGDTPQHISLMSMDALVTRKLDDVLMKDNKFPYIHLMKIDAQGYEVKILHGASKLFASGAVEAVKFELATDWLVKQGTSSAEYMNTYMGYGFQIHDTDSKEVLSQGYLHSIACGPPVIQDFVAVRVTKGEVVTQKQIVC